MPDDTPMDAVDIAFVESLVPDGCVSQGFLAVASWIDEEGNMRWKLYTQLDMLLTGQLGLLELCKLELIKRCEPGDD